MNQVEELVEWGVKEVAYHFDEDYINTEVIARKVVIEILSHPDLALIVEKELPKNPFPEWDSLACQYRPPKWRIYHNSQEDMLKWHKESIIPLAEALESGK